MYFKLYSNNSATLKEWSRQLNVINKENYPLYSTVNQTLSHWKTILNKNVGINTFELGNSEESTLSSWKNKLNNYYNK